MDFDEILAGDAEIGLPADAEDVWTEDPEQDVAVDVDAVPEDERAELEHDEAEEEDADKGGQEDEPEPQPEIMAAVSKELGIDFDSAEAFQEAMVQNYRANDTVVSVIQQDPRIGELINRLAADIASGKELDTPAAVEAMFGPLGEEPDPLEDPDEYREFIRRQETRKVLDNIAQENAEKNKKSMDDARALVHESFEKAVETLGLSKAEADALPGIIREFSSNPTVDFATVIYRGLNFEKLLKAEIDKAGKSSAEGVIGKGKKAQGARGDGVPRPKGRTASGKGRPRNKAEEDARLVKRQLEAAGDRDVLAEIVK